MIHRFLGQRIQLSFVTKHFAIENKKKIMYVYCCFQSFIISIRDVYMNFVVVIIESCFHYSHYINFMMNPTDNHVHKNKNIYKC